MIAFVVLALGRSFTNYDGCHTTHVAIKVLGPEDGLSSFQCPKMIAFIPKGTDLLVCVSSRPCPAASADHDCIGC